MSFVTFFSFFFLQNGVGKSKWTLPRLVFIPVQPLAPSTATGPASLIDVKRMFLTAKVLNKAQLPTL